MRQESEERRERPKEKINEMEGIKKIKISIFSPANNTRATCRLQHLISIMISFLKAMKLAKIIMSFSDIRYQFDQINSKNRSLNTLVRQGR